MKIINIMNDVTCLVLPDMVCIPFSYLCSLVCVEYLTKMALPVSPSDVVIMRVMVDRGDFEFKLGSETLGAECGGRGGTFIILHFSKVLSMIVAKVVCQQKSLGTI